MYHEINIIEFSSPAILHFYCTNPDTLRNRDSSTYSLQCTPFLQT